MPDPSEPTNLTNAPSVSSKEKSSFGTIIVLVLIVAMIVIAAFYVWGERVANDTPPTPTEETQ